MRKKIVSLCMALALCLGLLPVTALAAAPDGQVIYVGNENVTSGGYWTTGNDGTVTAFTGDDTPADNYIHYNANDNILTLHNATIKKGLDYTGSIQGSTYIPGSAIGVFNQNGAAELTITLEGTNTIEDVSTGIFVLANSSSTGGASLTIKGSGSLDASGILNGILVQSNGGDATLTIQSADVTLTSNSGNGVTVQAGSTDSSGRHTITLSVEGGSLTASGSTGISFDSASSKTVSATKLTVSNNAIVRANDVGSKISNVDLQIGKGNNSSGGIVFDGNKGTVYGSVTLQENLTIGEGESLDIPSGASLDTNDKLTVNGGTLTGDVTGEVIYKVTGVSLSSDTLTLNVGESSTLTTTITPDNATNKAVMWSSDNESVATVVDGIVTAVAPGTATITVTTADGGKTATCTVTVKHGNMVHTPKKDATCTAEGNKEYWTCGTCGKIFSDAEGKTEIELSVTVIPATGHNLTKTEEKAPTCTAEGNKEYWTCGTCGKIFSDAEGKTEIALEDTVIPATGHTFRGGWCAVCGARDPSYVPPANPNYRIDVTATEGGAVTKDPAAAKAGETVTLIPAPDAGYEVGDVTVTDRFGNAVEVTENADGTYTFTMPNGQVRVNVTFVEVQPEPLPFTDVAEGDWFHDAVRYVYDNGLMDGVGDGQFAPNATTNRAMVVTILYRLAGEPAVSGDVAFTDVESGLWYSNAVAWAAQKGIVNGVSETEFSPSGDLTREQLATILYRYAESMGYDVSAQADLSGFPDAGDIQSYATQALSWAVAEGLLQGFEDDTIRPGGTATRAQIATILMRFCEGVGA